MSVENLLRQKRDCLMAVLEMTENTIITGCEEDAESYIGLMEQREERFKAIYGLDEKISAAKGAGRLSKDAELMRTEIRKLVQEIVDADRRNEAAVAKVMSGIKASMKGVSMEKSLSYGYNNYVPMGDGVYFDKKN